MPATRLILPLLLLCVSCKSWGNFWYWKLSGTVVNLTGPGLALKNSGLGNASVQAGATNFTFSGGVSPGSEYNVTIASPATNQQCIVTNGRGIARADVSNIVVTCYTSGTLDNSFGSGGAKTLTNIGGRATAFDIAQNLVIDSADRIYIVGSSENTTPANVMIVCRLLTDGNLDTSFASGSSVPGCAIILNGTSSTGYGLVLDTANNRIYASGTNATPAMLIARLTMDGAIDTTFNGPGFARHSIGTNNQERRAVAVDSAGRPVIVGRVNCAVNCDWIVWRYTTGGVLDTAFNGLGYVQTSGGYSTAFDVLIQSDGRILATGLLNTTMTVRRYNPDGSPDTGFNGSGSYAYPMGSYTGLSGHAITRDAADNLLIAGTVYDGVDPGHLALWKLSPSGSLDTAFGSGGLVTHSGAGGGPANTTDFATGLVVDAFGRILVSGVSCNSNGFGNCAGPDYSSFSLVVWRYLPGGAPDTTFNSGSHFKLVDDHIFAQNIYTTRVGMKLDTAGRIVLAAGRDDDGVSAGDGQNLRLYRLFN